MLSICKLANNISGRDKATSNICTNQGLLALRTTVFLATVGPRGLTQMATLSHQKARYAADLLTQIPGVSLKFQQPFFREFLLQTPHPTAEVLAAPRTRASTLARISRGFN